MPYLKILFPVSIPMWLYYSELPFDINIMSVWYGKFPYIQDLVVYKTNFARCRREYYAEFCTVKYVEKDKGKRYYVWFIFAMYYLFAIF